jgi:hypothetical protein
MELYNQGYNDGIRSRKPTSDDKLYLLGHAQGWDDMMERDQMQDDDLRE